MHRTYGVVTCPPRATWSLRADHERENAVHRAMHRAGPPVRPLGAVCWPGVQRAGWGWPEHGPEGGVPDLHVTRSPKARRTQGTGPCTGQARQSDPEGRSAGQACNGLGGWPEHGPEGIVPDLHQPSC